MQISENTSDARLHASNLSERPKLIGDLFNRLTNKSEIVSALAQEHKKNRPRCVII